MFDMRRLDRVRTGSNKANIETLLTGSAIVDMPDLDERTDGFGRFVRPIALRLKQSISLRETQKWSKSK
jgi:hypothetical protein